MGQICCPKAQQVAFKEVETEKEVMIPSFSSRPDKDFSKLEGSYNLLQNISFLDYLMALTKFNMNNATVPEDYTLNRNITYSKTEVYFNEEFNADLFQSFIENKILKHPQVYEKAGNNETMANIFKSNLLNIHKSLIGKINQFRKENNKEVDKDAFKKSHAMAIGLLYCNSSNVYKIKFVFNLFAEFGKLNKTDDFKNFLLSLFLIPSYCQTFSRHKIGPTFPEIGELTMERMKEILDACELKDSVHLTNVVFDIIFPTETLIGYEQFKSLFERRENGIGWMISSKGIRSALQENNV